MKTATAISILALFAAPVIAQEILEVTCENDNKCQKRIAVPAGASVIIAPGIAMPNSKDCSFSVPTITTIVPPKFGKLVPKIVAYTAPARELGGMSTGACAGRTVKGLQLTYIANADANGEDKIVIVIQSKPRVAITEYNIKIR
ncbi:MAG: hypothetical protein HY242_09120 [Afipia sp.]|nr:hypothetical protein [Afipia sp.]